MMRLAKKRVVSMVMAVMMICSLLTPAAWTLTADAAETPAPAGLEFVKEGTANVLSWAEVSGASAYKVYRSESRYGTYSQIAEIAQTAYTDNTEVNYTYKISAVINGVESELSAPISRDIELFGENVYVFDDNVDSNDNIQEVINNTFTAQEANQFGSERYAFLFKQGNYNITANVGFYTQVAGLGLLPTDTKIAALDCSADWLGDSNATCNFWRAAENLEVTNTGETKWAVSQAVSLRRVKIDGNLNLFQINWNNGASGWASGGFLADSVVVGSVNPGGQQQWFSRNSDWASWSNGVWNMVFVGIEEGKAPVGTWPELAYTTVVEAPAVQEKPFLVYDEASDSYGVFIPELRRNAKGVSWKDGAKGETLSLDGFYLAKPEEDTADTINAALSAGKSIIFTPGIYRLNKALMVNNPNTILMGLGLASLTPTNGNSCIKIADVDGVKVCGLLFDAGTVNSETLLEVGATGSAADHAANPICLSDLYFRVGGTPTDKPAVADTCIMINSNDVIGDNFWVWRADHGDQVAWDLNVTKNGIIINGDDVTMYALMVEHFHEYQTIWNGNGGKLYFYQSEMPYDVPNQESWMSHDGTVNGYASYKVSDDVTSHEAYGLGIYSYFRDAQIDLNSAMEVPTVEGVKIVNVCAVMLAGYPGISHVVNNSGAGVNIAGERSEIPDYSNIVDSPVITPKTGYYNLGTTVSMKAQAGATIMYTMDGTEPSRTNGQVYTGEIVLNDIGSYTIKAMAFDDGKKDSYIATVNYVLGDIAYDKEVKASSYQENGNGTLPPELAVDGKPGTRWASGETDDEWIAVDLSGIFQVSRVRLTWEFAAGKEYLIQTATDESAWTDPDSSAWTTIHHVTDGEGNATLDISFDPVSARYIRMKGISRTTGYGYSIWEFEVYGASTRGLPETPDGLAVSKVTQDSISLEWNSAKDAAYYDVYRSNGGMGTYKKVATVKAPAYTDAGLVAGTYYYKVLAGNENGVSGFSDYVSQTIEGNYTPSAEIQEGTYIVKSRYDNMVFDVSGNDLVQMTYASKIGQFFSIEKADDNFIIRSVETGKVIEVAGASTEENALIQFADYTGAANQLWSIETIKQGYVKIINRVSGKAIDIPNATNNSSPTETEGETLAQKTYTGASTQQWELVPVNVDEELADKTPDLSTIHAWQENAIIYPYEASLTAAGEIYIEWYNPAVMKDAVRYELWIDGAIEATVDATDKETMEYLYYSTSAESHTLKIVAVLANGDKVPTGVRTFYVSKKGVGWGTLYRTEEMNLSWYYHWTFSPATGTDKKLQFVPMIWGYWGNEWLKNPENQKYRTILSFNEPDFLEQSNIPVDKALDAWPDFSASGLRVGSPATGVPGCWSEDWFRPFMEGIKTADGGYDVDFLAMHYYIGWPSAEAFLDGVDLLWEQYHKPIWITEFGVADWTKEWKNMGYSIDTVLQFMEEVVNGLDEREYVERYAWFPFDPNDAWGGASGIFDYDSGRLNSLGTLYKDLGIPAGYDNPVADTEPEWYEGETSDEKRPAQPSGNAPMADLHADLSGYPKIDLTEATAAASSEIQSAQNAIDGDAGSRWESESSDPQWLMVDTGKIQDMCGIKIVWEGASAKNYTVMVSDDGYTWTEVCQAESTLGARTDSILFEQMVSGRYVGIWCSSRTTGYGDSIFELTVYGPYSEDTVYPAVFTPGSGYYEAGQEIGITSKTPGASIRYTIDGSEPSETNGILYEEPFTLKTGKTTVRAVAYKDGMTTAEVTSAEYGIGEIAYGKTTEVSSGSGAAAVDRNMGTRWESAAEDPQWISVDLGDVYQISSVWIKWETAAAKSYQIQISEDKVNWTDVCEVTDGTGDAVLNARFGKTKGRYVRIYGTERVTQYGYSIWELEVYGTDSSVVDPKPESCKVTFINGNSVVEEKEVKPSEVLSAFAEVPEEDGRLFAGWFTEEVVLDSAAAITEAREKAAELVPITADTVYYAGWIDIGTVERAADDNSASAEEVSAFEVVGVQVRTANKTGLRFITRISTGLIAEIEALNDGNVSLKPESSADKGIGYGTVATMSSNLKGSSLVKDENAAYVANGMTVSPAVSNFAEYDHYVLYTCVITGIPGSHFKSDIAVRPYITYMDVNGNEHTYYYTEDVQAGGGYQTNLYVAAVMVYGLASTDGETKAWIKANILDRIQQ